MKPTWYGTMEWAEFAPLIALDCLPSRALRGCENMRLRQASSITSKVRSDVTGRGMRHFPETFFSSINATPKLRYREFLASAHLVAGGVA